MESRQERLADDPIAFIQSCVRGRRILWTYHVNLRIKGRSVPRRTVVGSVDSYEIVEAYPDDKYLPSYLLLARWADDAIHVLFATDVPGDNVRIVTAYRPSLDEWESDLKTRRTPQ